MKKVIWGISIVLVLVLVYYSYNPSHSNLFPKCPSLLLTGLQCPGCGSQRAIHHLLHLDVVQAFKYNALLVLSLPLVLVLLYAEISRKTRPNLYARINNTKFILTYFIIVILWSILRNIFHV